MIRDGVYGRLLTASNGNSLVLPAADYRLSSIYSTGEDGSYWSASFSTDPQCDAWGCYFKSDNQGVDRCGRFNGLSVRPVRSAYYIIRRYY